MQAHEPHPAASLLWIAAGGSVGAVLRFIAITVIQREAHPHFPLGTLCVNVAGCLLMGILFAWFEARNPLTPGARMALGVGLLGGFTTFSTFGWDALALIRAHRVGLAILYVLASNLLGLAAVAGGFFAARGMLHR